MLLQFGDAVGFVARQDFGDDLVDANLSCDGCGDGVIVTSDHCSTDVVLFEGGDGGV